MFGPTIGFSMPPGAVTFGGGLNPPAAAAAAACCCCISIIMRCFFICNVTISLLRWAIIWALRKPGCKKWHQEDFNWHTNYTTGIQVKGHKAFKYYQMLVVVFQQYINLCKAYLSSHARLHTRPHPRVTSSILHLYANALSCLIQELTKNIYW